MNSLHEADINMLFYKQPNNPYNPNAYTNLLWTIVGLTQKGGEEPFRLFGWNVCTQARHPPERQKFR